MDGLIIDCMGLYVIIARQQLSGFIHGRLHMSAHVFGDLPKKRGKKSYRDNYHQVQIVQTKRATLAKHQKNKVIGRCQRQLSNLALSSLRLKSRDQSPVLSMNLQKPNKNSPCFDVHTPSFTHVVVIRVVLHLHAMFRPPDCIASSPRSNHHRSAVHLALLNLGGPTAKTSP